MDLKETFKRLVERGLPLPHAYDPVPKEPSFRLLAAYISFIIASVSVIILHIFPSVSIATWTAIGYFTLCMVFYMLKKLTSAKIDLDDRQISLNSDEPEQK